MALYDDWIEEIDRTIAEIKNAAELIQELEKIKDRVEFRIESYEESYTYLILSGEDEALRLTSSSARRVLVSEGIDAILSVEEFNQPEFMSNFVKALELANITISPSNLDRCDVEIDLDSVAGNLDDYADAVIAARGGRGVGTQFNQSYNGVGNPAKMASHFWAEKYYSPERRGTTFSHPNPKRKIDINKYKEKFKETIALRIKNFKGLAPYWRLIDEGNLGISLKSDVGGTPFPVIKPTRFIHKTEQGIKDIYAYNIHEVRREAQNLSQTISELEKVLKYIDSKLNVDKLIREALEKRLKENIQFADVEKINNLISRIINKQELLEKEFIGNLPPGTRKDPRIRIRTKSLQKIVEAFRNR